MIYSIDGELIVSLVSIVNKYEKSKGHELVRNLTEENIKTLNDFKTYYKDNRDIVSKNTMMSNLRMKVENMLSLYNQAMVKKNNGGKKIPANTRRNIKNKLKISKKLHCTIF